MMNFIQGPHQKGVFSDSFFSHDELYRRNVNSYGAGFLGNNNDRDKSGLNNNNDICGSYAPIIKRRLELRKPGS